MQGDLQQNSKIHPDPPFKKEGADVLLRLDKITNTSTTACSVPRSGTQNVIIGQALRNYFDRFCTHFLEKAADMSTGEILHLDIGDNKFHDTR